MGKSSLLGTTTLEELDDYLRSRFRGLLHNDEARGSSRQLDVMSEVHGQVVIG